MKYIDADKLIAEIERRIEGTKSMKPTFDQFWAGQISAFKGALKIVESLQQEQPIRGPHTESWIEETKQELQHEEELLDMRLETLKRIRDKKNQFQQEQPLTTEKVIEQCKKFGGNPEVIYQEQPEVELEREIGCWMDTLDDRYCILVEDYSIRDIKDTARHFYELARQKYEKKYEKYNTK